MEPDEFSEASSSPEGAADRFFRWLGRYGQVLAGPGLNMLVAVCFLSLILLDLCAAGWLDRVSALGWCLFVAFLKIAQAINNLAAAVRQWEVASRTLGASSNN